MKILLAGDVGGTKTSLGLYTFENGPCRPLQTRTYASASYSDLETLVREFLTGKDTMVTAACFGVAGPVVNGQATLTNLPWRLDEKELSQALNIPDVLIINDLSALAESIPLLTEGTDLLPLNTGSPAPKGNRAVIAPGTGLGESFAVWDDAASLYRVHPSEGGHCDFAPRDDLETMLLHHLWVKIGHVSYENICSGLGIRNIYQFLKESGTALEPPWLTEALSRTDDPTPLIMNNALDREQGAEISRKALDIFISVLGAEAGNLALKVLATGGVYLGGGIPKRILPLLSREMFFHAFTDKGRFHDFMSRIPIHVIVHPDAALIGAARCGMASF